MGKISRREFAKAGCVSAVGLVVWNNLPRLMANPLGLPVGIQLYSVRDMLPKEFEGTLRQLGKLGFREVEAAGFFNHSPAQVKQAMKQANLRCVSAHYPLKNLLPQLEETIQFGKDIGLDYIVCAAPWFKDPSKVKDPDSPAARESMTSDDWRWNADQFNHIGERVSAAGMNFAYHNHVAEFRSENGVAFYDQLMQWTDPPKVAMELDCGWAAVAGRSPAEYISKYPARISMLHVKDFKLTRDANVSSPPPSTELGKGTIDYRPIFEAAKKASIKHAFVEQEQFDMPAMEALKIDADYMKALTV